jgi:hypothetical protein
MKQKEEVAVAKKPNYKGDKRRKETERLKKQEEKRQRRFTKGQESEDGQGDANEHESAEGSAAE